ncbi:ABC transporter ATP-binding protein [Pontiella sulfatireligans]|uniref:ABC transporter ATP-binding protein NatA n=1 Tax=Pontiella sulfatireligans TaxID=2750658 RepID=A0A6C2ULZ6_9BACT|nr:ATP-binding cassette domain-containing protein [Pontiella sulfatireligans]VGO20136.1 ABC transporter ATP-binding protein NatA [Pontiella sulfatireligans]
MIKVSEVTKKYPARLAVDNISFEVNRGEIVGFLGPNGAGKTTTMRMLAGYFPMNSGSIEVAGFDVRKDAREVRKRIGYLPESCPLYPEMRVDEYLRFRAELKGVKSSARKAKIAEVKEQCGLTDVGKRIIGQLSKGYRQRVGLADSLVHDPDLLILDEPTVGLDPIQIRQVRELIKQLAERHTILLSTHILQEVEAICERILIINEGKIVASDTEENLHRKLHACAVIEMEVAAEKAHAIGRVNALPGLDVRNSNALPDGWLRMEIEADSPEMRVDLFNLAVTEGWVLRELSEQEHSLEDTFVQITRNLGVTP